MKKADIARAIEKTEELNLDALAGLIEMQECELFNAVGDEGDALGAKLMEVREAEGKLEEAQTKGEEDQDTEEIERLEGMIQELAGEALKLAHEGAIQAAAMADNLLTVCGLIENEFNIELVDNDSDEE